MAIATSAAIMGGAALAGSGLQIAQGMKQTEDAKDAYNNFERQKLQNIYKDMPISLLGSNLRREDASQTTANLTEAARGSGIRGVFGALPRIQSVNNQASRQNQLDVDNQVMKREYAIAGDEARIQGMQENRDNQDLAGIGQQLAVGQQNTQSGIRGAFNGIGLAGSGVEGTIGGGGVTPETYSVGMPISMPMNASAPPTGSMLQTIPGSQLNQDFTQDNFLSDYYEQQKQRRLYNEAAPKQFG